MWVSVIWTSFTRLRWFDLYRFQFHQRFTHNFFVQKCLRHFYLVTVWLWNFLAQKYWRKSCSLNVDKIDYFRRQFPQCFTMFYVHRSQKRKNVQLSHQYLFTLLGSASVKAEVECWWNWALYSTNRPRNFVKCQLVNDVFLSSSHFFEHFWHVWTRLWRLSTILRPVKYNYYILKLKKSYFHGCIFKKL